LKNELKPLLLVVNPKAGRGFSGAELYETASLFSESGYEVTLYITRPGSTANYLRENAARYERIVTTGGDGTFSEVLSGVLDSGADVPIGYIPTGSTNDFAATLSLPKRTLKAARIAADGTVKAIDTGKFGDKHFTYIAAAGAFTEVSYSTSQKLKNSLGHLSYLMESARALGSIKEKYMKAEFNGQCIEGSYMFVAVSNTTSIGGVIKVNRDNVDISDGFFELILAKKPHIGGETIEFISNLISKKYDSKYISFYKTDNVKLSFETETVFTLDGERSEPCLSAEISVCKKAVKLIL